MFSIAAYGISCAIQSYIAPYSPSFVGATPLYLLGNIDPTFFLIFQIATLFLVFDVDQRNSRNRVAEVLESRPLSNLEYLAGRVLGIAGLLWIVAAANILAMQSFGLVAQWTNFEVGGSLQLHSIFNLLFLDAPVTLLLWCSLVVLLSSVTRSRIATFAIALVGMLAWYLLVSITPYAFLELVSPSSNDTLIVSDLLPELPSLTSLMLRIGTVFLAALMTIGAVQAYKRTDVSLRAPTLIVVTSLTVLGITACFSVAGINVLQQQISNATWREAHQMYEKQSGVDVQKIQGSVHIDPRKQLSIDLHLDLLVDSEQTKTNLVFTLNPGMKISSIELNSIQQSFSFANGILDVTSQQSLEPNTAHTLRIVARGVPNPRFTYQDAPFDYMLDPNASLEVTRSFGREVTVFEDRYVALMPNSYWYPVPGLVNGHYGDEEIKKDYFELDLTVEIANSSWLLAGPSVAPKNDVESNLFEVKPSAPVSGCGLFASKFVRATTEIEGVAFSLFLHARHAKNLHIPERVWEDLNGVVAGILQKLAQHGLDLPQQSLSIVEVPSRLRTLGGGWRMDSLSALPGVILLKERGYPVARMDLVFRRELDPELEFIRFMQFFTNGLGTDNIFYTIHKHYWSHATSASGRYAELLDHFTLSLLSSYILVERDARWFSLYGAIPFLKMAKVHPLYGISIGSADQSVYRSRIQKQEHDYVRRDSVLDRVERNSLANLPSGQGHQRDLELMLLKVEKISEAFVSYGQEPDKVLSWIATVRERFYGRTYRYEDLIDIAKDHGIVVHPFLSEWLTASAIPGFIASPATIVRLSDDEDGSQRYQTKFSVRNSQPVEGFVSVNHMNETTSIHIDGRSAKEISFISNSPPSLDSTGTFGVYAGLSLNRENLQIPLDVTHIPWYPEARPSVLEEESDWEPETMGIVVDDLDEGFSVTQPRAFMHNSRLIGPARWFLWPTPDIEHDGQLPNVGPWYVLPRGWWRRSNERNAYGTYRGTLAITHVGNNSKSNTARFAAQIPENGQWSLEFHVHHPDGWFGYGALAKFLLVVGNGTESRSIEFDPATSEVGWVFVDKFDLQAGNVNVDVVGATKRSTIYADAIRWIQLGDNEQSSTQEPNSSDMLN